MNKKRRFSLSSDNLAWGLTALIVICLSITFYLLLTQMPEIKNGISTLRSILMPIILGFIIAYLLIPVYNALFVRFSAILEKRLSGKNSRSIAKGLSTLVSLSLFIAVVVGLLIMAGPQVIQSIVRIIEGMPSNVDKATAWATKLLKDHPQAASIAANTIADFENWLLNFVQTYVTPYINDIIGGITTGVVSAVTFVFDLIVGLIVCIYVLTSKDTFSAQAKKMTYSIFGLERANRIVSDTRKIHKIFSGFISGKLIDSLIIGMITFVALTIMNIPYAVMISVVVGVTNIIPFFGPFIGAIPSALIILTADPVKSLYFIIYVIIIQQIDGNIIGPKILGNSTGLPSFWVLFSILVGGGLFGLAGMILGVPIFATVYMFVSRGVDASLIKKDFSPDTNDYREVRYIDPKTRNFVMRNGNDKKKQDSSEKTDTESESPKKTEEVSRNE